MDRTFGIYLNPDDEVVELPTISAPPSELLEVAKIAHADSVGVHLQDGRLFSIHSGVGINTTGYIAPASHAHRDILKMLAIGVMGSAVS